MSDDQVKKVAQAMSQAAKDTGCDFGTSPLSTIFDTLMQASTIASGRPLLREDPIKQVRPKLELHSSLRTNCQAVFEGGGPLDDGYIYDIPRCEWYRLNHEGGAWKYDRITDRHESCHQQRYRLTDARESDDEPCGAALENSDCRCDLRAGHDGGHWFAHPRPGDPKERRAV